MLRMILVIMGLSLGACSQDSGFSGSEAKKKQPAAIETPRPTTPPDTTLGEPEESVWDDPAQDPEPVDDGLLEGGDNVVEAGSFRAWTIPEDPAPRQSYQIVIEVNLPSDVEDYRKDDLSGLVIGTDEYRQQIGGDGNGFFDSLFGTLEDFEVGVGRAQLTVMVPGAANLVEDTIEIESAILGESQTLKIIF